MPPLICPSPAILDHSFPRSEAQLKGAAIALGQIMKSVQTNNATLVLTKILREFVQRIDWTQKHQALLREIYRFLSQLYLQTNKNLLVLDVSWVKNHKPHPIPLGTEEDGQVLDWADELGKLLLLHDQSIKTKRFFIGIACEKAFSGDMVNSYCTMTERAFPLVGPQQLALLEDSYEWEVPPDAHGKTVGFDDVKQNFKSIGGSSFEAPSRGGSHYKLRFSSNACWVCDRNWGNDIGDNVLNQLKDHSGLPLPVIKFALLNGNLPRKRLRIKLSP